MEADKDDLPVLKFVLDSNVWIDGYTSCGNTAWRDRKLVRDCIKKASQNGIIIVDDRTMHELEKKMSEFVADALLFRHDAEKILSEVRLATKRVELEKGYIRKNIDELRKCEDGNDWSFLILADTHKAHAIVSSDKHLLSVVQYKDVKILSPQRFIVECLPERQCP